MSEGREAGSYKFGDSVLSLRLVVRYTEGQVPSQSIVLVQVALGSHGGPEQGRGVHRAVWLLSPSLLAWTASFSPLFSAFSIFWFPSHSFLPPPPPFPSSWKGDCASPQQADVAAAPSPVASTGRATRLVLSSTKLGCLRPSGPQFPYLLTEG